MCPEQVLDTPLHFSWVIQSWLQAPHWISTSLEFSPVSAAGDLESPAAV